MNQIRQRATAVTITAGKMYLVSFRGVDIIIVNQHNGKWHLRRRGSEERVMAVVEEKDGLGKEEIIEWIELNY